MGFLSWKKHGKFAFGTFGTTDHGEKCSKTPQNRLPDQSKRVLGNNRPEGTPSSGAQTRERNPDFPAAGQFGGNRPDARRLA